jgi:hypothetical protein
VRWLSVDVMAQRGCGGPVGLDGSARTCSLSGDAVAQVGCGGSVRVG